MFLSAAVTTVTMAAMGTHINFHFSLTSLSKSQMLLQLPLLPWLQQVFTVAVVIQIHQKRFVLWTFPVKLGFII
jgi:hypothetical protein